MYPFDELRSVARGGEEAAEDFKKLGELAKVETDFDEVLLSTEDRLCKARIARAMADATTPPNALELHRIWRDLDALMGPGQSMLHVLCTQYPPLATATDRMSRLLRASLRVRTPAARKLALESLDIEISNFAALSSKIKPKAAEDLSNWHKTLKERYGAADYPEFMNSLGRQDARKKLPDKEELLKEAAAALSAVEDGFKTALKAAKSGKDSRAVTKAFEESARIEVEWLKEVHEATGEKLISLQSEGKQIPRTAELASRISSLSAFASRVKKSPVELGTELAAILRFELATDIPILEHLRDTHLFMEVLGVVAQAKSEKHRLLLNFANSSDPAKDPVIKGYVRQLLGLLPEASAVHMNFMPAAFSKRAFEVLSEFPEHLRGMMMVEIVPGPLWVWVRRSASPAW